MAGHKWAFNWPLFDLTPLDCAVNTFGIRSLKPFGLTPAAICPSQMLCITSYCDNDQIVSHLIKQECLAHVNCGIMIDEDITFKQYVKVTLFSQTGWAASHVHFTI